MNAMHRRAHLTERVCPRRPYLPSIRDQERVIAAARSVNKARSWRRAQFPGGHPPRRVLRDGSTGYAELPVGVTAK